MIKQKEADAERTKILEHEGYTVIRFTNDQILNNISDVITEIKQHLRPLYPPEGGMDSPGTLVVPSLISPSGPSLISPSGPLVVPPSGPSLISPSGDKGAYEDIPGFCKSVSIEEIRKLDYVLTPGALRGATR